MTFATLTGLLNDMQTNPPLNFLGRLKSDQDKVLQRKSGAVSKSGERERARERAKESQQESERARRRATVNQREPERARERAREVPLFPSHSLSKRRHFLSRKNGFRAVSIYALRCEPTPHFIQLWLKC